MARFCTAAEPQHPRLPRLCWPWDVPAAPHRGTDPQRDILYFALIPQPL